jgi:hypothetical protein
VEVGGDGGQQPDGRVVERVEETLRFHLRGADGDHWRDGSREIGGIRRTEVGDAFILSKRARSLAFMEVLMRLKVVGVD